MKSQVLWLLDNEADDRSFERLSTSLMYRWGYRHIKPFGGNYDGGRDAEMTIHDVILPRFGGHHPKGVDGVHGGAEEAACSPQVH